MTNHRGFAEPQLALSGRVAPGEGKLSVASGAPVFSRPQFDDFKAVRPLGDTLDAARRKQAQFSDRAAAISAAEIRTSMARAMAPRTVPDGRGGVARVVDRSPGIVARRKLDQLIVPMAKSIDVVLFEADIEGTGIRLLATPPRGGI